MYVYDINRLRVNRIGLALPVNTFLLQLYYISLWLTFTPPHPNLSNTYKELRIMFTLCVNKCVI